MGLTCLIFLAVVSVVVVTECKPFSDYFEKTPCVDCEQKNWRRKRSYQFVFTQSSQNIELELSCDCDEDTISYTMINNVPGNGSPDIYIGNGKNNENHVVINGANNVYIGNGAHNTNHVTFND